MTAPLTAAPVVAWSGSDSLEAPLVVLLHGRGSDERSMSELAALLPVGPAYAAVRGPLGLDTGGFAWIANRGIGRPVPESLRASLDWFASWRDRVVPASRPVVLVGFSGGALFTSALVLDDPVRYDGAAILHGNLPFDGGVDLSAGRLAGRPILVTRGARDEMIDPGLSERTWSWLHHESGAELTAHLDPGGHTISQATLDVLVEWLTARL